MVVFMKDDSSLATLAMHDVHDMKTYKDNGVLLWWL